MVLAISAVIAVAIIAFGIFLFITIYYRKANKRNLEKLKSELGRDDDYRI